jgi:hypothetical protein
MAEMQSRYSVEALVQAGRSGRSNAIASVALDPQQLLWHAEAEGKFDPRSLEVYEVDEKKTLVRQAPAQIDNGVVTWVVEGELPAGKERRYRIGVDTEDSPAVQALGKPVFRDRVILTDMGKELLVSQNRTELGRYQYRDVWKPFFAPLYGPQGNVVRAIEKEHPHQHGLYISYGGEDCLGVNIWSEEETLRPPLGPSGKMVHDGFERIEYGWVYGQFVQRLNYLKPGGHPFARELRTVRFYAPSATTRIVDWTVRLEDPADTGHRRVALACRVANSIRTRDLDQKSTDGMMGVLRENGGKIENSEGGTGELASRGGQFAWLDFSGPVENGTDGIALFGHPSNPGGSGKYSCREYGVFTIGLSYPTEGFERGGAATFRYRAFIHGGDATEGGVAQAYADYVNPCRVVIGKEIVRR